MKKVREGYKITEFGEIPENWEIKSIGEIFDFSGGLSISRAKLIDKGVNYLHYGDIHMRNENYIDTEKDDVWLPKIEDKFEDIKDNVKLSSGDVVFADASEDYEGIGKSVAIFNDFEKPFVAGLHTIVAKDINKQLDNSYKRYCFSTNEVRKQFRYLAVGTSVYGISRENIKKIKINVPTIKEQEKIALILSTVDEQIDNVDGLIKKNKELKKGLMQQLLIKGIGHTKFKKTEIGEIPEEWEVKKLKDLGSSIIGLTYSPDDLVGEGEGTLVLRSSNIKNSRIVFDDNKYVKTNIQDKLIVKEDDILICSRNGSKNLIGKCALIDKKTEGCSFGAFMTIYRSHYNKYLFNVFTSYMFKRQIYNNLGATINQITTDNLNNFKVILPPIKEQEKIASILSKVDENIDEYVNKKQKLEELKKGLMQQLLTGRTRVI